MCQDRNHGGGRCPSDTSEARQLRRKNSGARTSYATLTVQPTPPKNLTPSTPEPAHTVESIRKDIENYHNLSESLKHHLDTPDRESRAIVEAAYDEHLNRIGEGVAYLAETKYDAPTDEHIRELWTQTDKEANEKAQDLHDEATALANKTNEELEQLIDEMDAAPNRSDYPTRLQHWREESPDIYAAYQKKRDDVHIALAENSQQREAVLAQVDDTVKSVLEKRNTAIVAALEEVGVTFADPESLQVADDSHKKAVQSLRKAIAYYPQQWVDNSNEQSEKLPLRVKDSKGRAHYSSAALQDKFALRPFAMVQSKPADWTPDPLSRADSEWVDLKGEDTWTEPKTGRVYSNYDIHYGDNMDGKKSWLHISYEYRRSPRRGYEEVQYRDYSGEVVTAYRKPRMERIRIESEVTSELTVSKDAKTRVGDDPSFRVALHEFAHRVEHTTPQVQALEDAFLKRRTGRLPIKGAETPEPEQPTAIYLKKREIGYKDNFPTHYMGKVYSDGYREILSMGMETLFAGKNGAFSGIDNYSPDPDYKKFVLGILASTAK